MAVQVGKNCYKLTNFSSAVNQNRFQLSLQFDSSKSSYDVILVTFPDVFASRSYCSSTSKLKVHLKNILFC